MKRFVACVHYTHLCCLTLGPSPFLFVIHVVTIGTMLNNNDGYVTYKQTSIRESIECFQRIQRGISCLTRVTFALRRW